MSLSFAKGLRQIPQGGEAVERLEEEKGKRRTGTGQKEERSGVSAGLSCRARLGKNKEGEARDVQRGWLITCLRIHFAGCFSWFLGACDIYIKLTHAVSVCLCQPRAERGQEAASDLASRLRGGPYPIPERRNAFECGRFVLVRHFVLWHPCWPGSCQTLVRLRRGKREGSDWKVKHPGGLGSLQQAESPSYPRNKAEDVVCSPSVC